MSRRGLVGAIVGSILLVAVVAIIGLSSSDPGTPLDPDNAGPVGTKALRLLLEEVGADVRVAESHPHDGDVALVLRDRLSEDSQARLLEYVTGGGTLVVADPSSPLANDRGDRAPGGGNECTIGAWDTYDIEFVQPPSPPLDPDGGAYCLGTDTGAVVTVRTEGAGVVVSLASAQLLTNEHLGEFDNARLAVAALAPEAGLRVVILDPDHVETPLPGSGDESLWDLVPGGVKWALLQLAIAFGLFVLAAGRRHGRPVVETTPVELAASDLVAATGTMYERSRQTGFAGAVLQHDLRGIIARRTALPPDSPAASLAAAAEVHFGVDAQSVERALAADPADEGQLLDLARSISTIRQEVLDG